jgi:3-deoxy-manno-octulosonate cytidylyltransferase (CMP-KDO synthetase)
MIQHVWQQACKSSAARVVIATDDKRIEEAATAFGAEVCMTRDDHISGTDRLQEVAQTLDLADEQIIVNVQGDEPLIPPEVINQVATNLANSSTAGVATLCEPLSSVVDFVNPNTVKVVSDAMSNALYFSRAPIPFPQDKSLGSDNSLPENARRHIGIYAYKVASINQFVHWNIAPLERLESLEQLRFLANGIAIHVTDACATVPGGVDTEDDFQAIINSL